MIKRIAFQMDALGRLNLRGDSTLSIARAAAERGYALFHYEPYAMHLNIADGVAKVTADGHTLVHNPNNEIEWSLEDPETVDLATFDALLMRQDPPFDLNYITATHILEHIQDKFPIINSPSGVRNAPEKILPTFFPQLMPPTLISRDPAAIAEFRTQHKDIVIKPIYSHGGRGVFHISPQDDNLQALMEMLRGMNTEPWIIQKFLPVMTLGDKRIVLLDGKPVGLFRRIPSSSDMRSNMRVGGRVEKCPLTPRDREICEVLAPTLVQQGLRLVGLDVIGDYLTEINVTSPTGLVTSDELDGRRGKDTISAQFWRMVFG